MTDPHAHALSAEQVARFLGMQAPPSGPHELLGLDSDPAAWTAREVSDALLNRLQRIDEHPQARTPEADELRVALHVAAAQLKDPRVRSRIAEAGAGTDDSMPEVATPMTDPLAAPTAIEVGRQEVPAGVAAGHDAQGNDDFSIAARHVLASCGGWNPRSKRLLGYLARSASVDALVLQRTLVDITNQYSSAPSDAATSNGVMNDTPTRELRSPASVLSRSSFANRPLDLAPTDARTRTWMTLGSLAMLAASGVLATLLVATLVQRAVSGSDEIATNVVNIPSPQAGAGADTKSPSDFDREGVDRNDPNTAPDSSGFLIESDAVSVIRLLRTLDEDAFARAPEESIAAFVDSLKILSGSWDSASVDALSTAPLALRDAVLSASAHDLQVGARLVEELKSLLDPLDTADRIVDPRRLRSSAFGYGICGLLAETPILPREERALRSRLNSIASRAGLTLDVGNFNRIVETALRVQSEGLVPRAADASADTLVPAWDAWLNMCDALPTQQRTALKLDAIEKIAKDGEDPVFHAPSGRILGKLVSAMDWSSEDRTAAQRLLSWFDDTQSVSTKALSVMTTEFVDASLISSLSSSHVLSSSASTDQRRAVRDQYALRLGLPQTGDGRLFASDWAGFAEELLGLQTSPEPAEAMNIALRSSWLNESAALWIASQERAALEALDKSRGSLDALVAASGGAVRFDGSRVSRADGEWASDYLQSRRSASDRTRLLYELANTGGPAGQADADVLAEAASYSTPIEVRAIAQRVVLDHSTQPEVVLGLLEVLPRAAKQDRVSDMIATVTGRSLPSVDSQSWRAEARAALVSRSLEMLVSEQSRVLDVAAGAMADSYAIRRDLLPAPATPSNPGDDFSAEQQNDGSASASQVVREYVDRLYAAARKLPAFSQIATLEEIRARRAWRVRLVRPGVGAFTAEQTTGFVLYAYAISSERPELMDRVGVIVRDAAEMRRGAASVYEQIAANELAVLRLNHLRLTGGENR
jgi:hypothetical protein